MFREILTSRSIHIGVVFFVGVVGSSFLYSWHVQRTTEAELAKTNNSGQALENDNAVRREPATYPVEFETSGEAETLMETDNTETIPEATVAFIDDAEIRASTDLLDAFLEETLETENEAGPYGVSPFGFGPFPEIPPDYPDQDIWDDIRTSTGMEPYSELVIRTRIALWNQGIHTVGAMRDNTYNLIYPIIDDVVYIKWADNLGPEGEPYVQRVLTSPTTEDNYDLHKGIFPPHLTIYEFPDGGIDPYDFLGLPR